MKSLFFLLPLMMSPLVLVVATPHLFQDCSTLTGYNKTNSTESTGPALICHNANNQIANISILLLLPGMLLPLLGMFRCLLSDDDDDKADKKLIKAIKTEIPNAESLTKIPCALCSKNVDRPYNLIKHLGVEQTKQYLAFCDETKTDPTLYCCSCYAMVQRNPNWQRAMDNMIDDSIKYGELKKINLMKAQEERI